jgi:hypothetical protein
MALLDNPFIITAVYCATEHVLRACSVVDIIVSASGVDKRRDLPNVDPSHHRCSKGFYLAIGTVNCLFGEVDLNNKGLRV